MNCQNCIDQKIDVQELNQKLEMQVRLTEYWKAIALKYEPEHEDPKWSIDYVEKVTIELLDVPPPSPPPEKVFKRNLSHSLVIILIVIFIELKNDRLSFSL